MKRFHRNQLILIATIALTTFFGFSVPEELLPEEINWDTHFRGEPDENSAFAALTVTAWNYDYKATVRNKHLHIEFNFTGGVDRDRSWVKRGRIRNRQIRKQLLNHEQGHVNINFFLLRESDAKIRNQRYSISNYKKLIQKNANRLSDYYNKMQDRYDEETKHGTDLAAQDRWDAFFKQELEKYSN